MSIDESSRSVEIRQARRIIGRALLEDSSFKKSYIADVASLLYDECGGGVRPIEDHEMRNKLAWNILRLIFFDKGSPVPYL